MDDADRAARSEEWMMKAAQEERKPEGPRPKIVSVCLFCGEEIEQIPATMEGIKHARRWCDAECRNLWERDHERIK